MYMIVRVFVLCSTFILSACSFNGVFFPVDERADDVVERDIEQVELVSNDGKKIQHYLFKPDHPAKATIFIFQGSASKVINWFSLVKPLVDDGYQVFMMEYRGFGASEGEAEHDLVANDANIALNYLVGRASVKDKPLLVLGQSYGGQLAIYVTHKNQNIVDGLITEGTFTSFSEEAAFSSPWLVSPLVKLIVSNDYESEQLIRDIHTNTLIIHSKEDKVVPFNMAQVLFNKASGNKELWVIQGKHIAGLKEEPKAYVSKVNEFLYNILSKTLQRY